MIVALAWKELREHRAIWLTMVVMTVGLGLGLSRAVALGDVALAVPVAALTILGMAATYGVVCGSMMLAGEREGGTLVFLDIFMGRRGLLWLGKFAIGMVLVLTQSLAVAVALRLLRQEPPGWAMTLMGQRDVHPDPNVWFLILPVVTLEAYAWGLLGSCLAQRVLAGAAVAAVGVTPVVLLGILAPPEVFFTLQCVIGVVVLAASLGVFSSRSQEMVPTLLPEPAGPLDSKDQFLELWEEFEREDDLAAEELTPETPTSATVARPGWDPIPSLAAPRAFEPRSKKFGQAVSPNQVLWWLTLEQARPVFWGLAVVGFFVALISPVNAQVLWPLVTLLLGVACGTAAFSSEQRDLSYQFLAAQHFPLKTIWRFKILFWLALAVLVVLVIAFGHYLSVAFRPAPAPFARPFGFQEAPVRPNDGFQGTLPALMGPTLFFGVWLLYGFSVGQVIVWLCRKNILALLVSFLVAAGAVGMWLPSLLCGGMSGWQVGVAPLILLSATWCLMRAWTGGRIQERKPLAALVGFASAAIVWALVNFGYRAWEIPDVGESLAPVIFRASIPPGNDTAAGKAIHQAIVRFEDLNDGWHASMAEAARLPVGVLEMPRADGQAPLLKHLPTCRKMTASLLKLAQVKEPGAAFEHIAQVLALSRTLRNKAPLESYLAGIQAEQDALTSLDLWLARGKPAPKLLRRVLDELDRHAKETPPPIDCLQTECFRSRGVLDNPGVWAFAAQGTPDRIPEQWLVGSIALSLEMPWEAERKTRLWHIVWAGLFLAIETPHWEFPDSTKDLPVKKPATQKILRDWLSAAHGPGAAMTRAHLARLLDASWLADERLFPSISALREVATHARWHVDATRQTIALGLYRVEVGKSAQKLQDLVPKYFRTGLPIDPYSGQPYHYGILPENQLERAPGAVAGQGIIWSTGPNRLRRHIKLAPHWP